MLYIFLYLYIHTHTRAYMSTCFSAHNIHIMYVRMDPCTYVYTFNFSQKKNFEMAAENIKVGSSPYNFIHELIVYIVSSPVTSKNKSSLHTFLFSWSTMSGTSVGNFVQSCATEKTRNPQNTNRSSQPHCLSIFLYFNKQFRKSM